MLSEGGKDKRSKLDKRDVSQSCFKAAAFAYCHIEKEPGPTRTVSPFTRLQIKGPQNSVQRHLQYVGLQ